MRCRIPENVKRALRCLLRCAGSCASSKLCKVAITTRLKTLQDKIDNFEQEVSYGRAVVVQRLHEVSMPVCLAIPSRFPSVVCSYESQALTNG